MLYSYSCSESELIAENNEDAKLLLDLWSSLKNAKNSKVFYDEDYGLIRFTSD